MCDWSLTRCVDDQGRPWVICQSCVEWFPIEELAIDPEDGLHWDICITCDAKAQAWENQKSQEVND